jgi:hypothetical protein
MEQICKHTMWQNTELLNVTAGMLLLLLLLHESYHFFRKQRYICSELTVVKQRNKTRVNAFVKYGISQSGILICMERNNTRLASNSQGWVEPLLKEATIPKGFMMFRVIYY